MKLVDLLHQAYEQMLDAGNPDEIDRARAYWVAELEPGHDCPTCPVCGCFVMPGEDDKSCDCERCSECARRVDGDPDADCDCDRCSECNGRLLPGEPDKACRSSEVLP